MIEPFRADHLDELILQPHQRAWQGKISRDQLMALEKIGGAFTLRTDRIIGCGGVIPDGEDSGRGVAWALLAQDAGPAMLRATKAVRRYLELSPYRRIVAYTAKNFTPGRRWAVQCGFRFEAELEGYCHDGSPGEQWARVR